MSIEETKESIVKVEKDDECLQNFDLKAMTLKKELSEFIKIEIPEISAIKDEKEIQSIDNIRVTKDSDGSIVYGCPRCILLFNTKSPAEKHFFDIHVQFSDDNVDDDYFVEKAMESLHSDHEEVKNTRKRCTSASSDVRSPKQLQPAEN